MIYAGLASGLVLGYVVAYLVVARHQVAYVASKHGLVRHRSEHFCFCDNLLKPAFAPLTFLHFIVCRSFWLEYQLPKMQSSDHDRAAMLPVVRQIGLIGGLAVWDDHLVSVSFMRRPITDAQLSIVSAFSPVVDLDLSGTSVTDTGMQHINQLPNLRTLDLTNTLVTDAGVSMLRKTLPGVSVWREK